MSRTRSASSLSEQDFGKLTVQKLKHLHLVRDASGNIGINTPCCFEGGRTFDLSVRFARTGRGVMFHCPECDRNAAILYVPLESGGPACRVCVGLSYRSQLSRKPVAPPKPVPDYARLVDVLLDLRNLPNERGETKLNRAEAKRIRDCGIEARAGNKMWRCPELPHDLVRKYFGLRHLSDENGHLWRNEWHPERAAIRRVTELHPLATWEQRLITMLRNAPDYRLTKRTVQQKMWRLGNASLTSCWTGC